MWKPVVVHALIQFIDAIHVGVVGADDFWLNHVFCAHPRVDCTPASPARRHRVPSTSH